MSKSSDSSPGGLGGILRRGKRLLGLFRGPAAAEAGPAPGVAPAPEESVPRPRSPASKPTQARSGPPRTKEDASSSLGHTGVFDSLRELIVRVGLLLGRVKSFMTGLSRSYQAAVGPTRLQLYLWAYPKGSPPSRLYWARLAPKKVELCDEFLQISTPKRPRWCKFLEIRCRKDLGSAIHWNGLDAKRKTVLRYYEPALALNSAHRSVAKRLPQMVKTFERKAGGVREVSGEPEMPWDPIYDRLCCAVRLLRPAWKLQWVVETQLARLNQLLSRDGRPGVRLRMKRSKGSLDPDLPCPEILYPVFYREGASTEPGYVPFRGCGYLESVLGCNPADEGVELVKSLEDRVDLIQTVIFRLCDIYDWGEFELEKFYSEDPRTYEERHTLYESW